MEQTMKWQPRSFQLIVPFVNPTSDMDLSDRVDHQPSIFIESLLHRKNQLEPLMNCTRKTAADKPS